MDLFNNDISYNFRKVQNNLYTKSIAFVWHPPFIDKSFYGPFYKYYCNYFMGLIPQKSEIVSM